MATILFPDQTKQMRLTWERRGRKVFEPRRRRYKTDDSAGRAELSTPSKRDLFRPPWPFPMREATTTNMDVTNAHR